jgi:hypothetical protein
MSIHILEKNEVRSQSPKRFTNSYTAEVGINVNGHVKEDGTNYAVM